MSIFYVWAPRCGNYNRLLLNTLLLLSIGSILPVLALHRAASPQLLFSILSCLASKFRDLIPLIHVSFHRDFQLLIS